MRESIFIKFEHGGMEIYVNEFFPCSQAKFNRLFKIIREFSWLNNVQELAAQLELNFKRRIPELKSQWQDNGRKYLDAMQKCSDLGRMVESGKRPSGVRLKKEELTEFREQLKNEKKQMAAYLRACKKNKRLAEALEKNLKMVEQVGQLHG